jgi:hypothetical protein
LNGVQTEGQRVVLQTLGRYYFDQLGEDPPFSKPMSPIDATINPILSIKAQALRGKNVNQFERPQTVYVIVQSQTLQAVSNATGKATVHWPMVEQKSISLRRTGQGLVASHNLQIKNEGELVPIDIVVIYQGWKYNTDVVQDLVLEARVQSLLTLDFLSTTGVVDSLKSLQSKTGPSLQASFHSEPRVTAHTPHSAIPPRDGGADEDLRAHPSRQLIQFSQPFPQLRQILAGNIEGGVISPCQDVI